MTQSSNYIKVKSRRTLERENDAAELIIKKAGTSTSMPGGTGMPTGRSVATGVRMPGTFESQTFPSGDDPLTGTTKHTWTPSPGMGRASVPMPVEHSIPLLSSLNTYPPIPFDTRLRQWLLLYDTLQVFQRSPTTYDNVSETMPGATFCNGKLSPERSEGSVGRDIKSRDRIRREKLALLKKGLYGGE